MEVRQAVGTRRALKATRPVAVAQAIEHRPQFNQNKLQFATPWSLEHSQPPCPSQTVPLPEWFLFFCRSSKSAET